MAKPKAILFDIGGVCVVSPFQAIVDYESKNGIPKDYINFAISRSAPNGAWQRLERGEIKMDDEFFMGFRNDLHNPKLWEQYHETFKHRGRKKTTTELAESKATQLGDYISLKSETSNNNPTPNDQGASTSSKAKKQPSLKEIANRSMLGDPASLKAETSDNSPLPDDSGAPPPRRPATTQKGPGPVNKKKESYKKNMLGDPTSLKNEGSSSEPLPGQQETGAVKHLHQTDSNSTSPSASSAKSSSQSSSEQSESSLSNSAGTGNSLKDKYKKNMLGDPTSLKNEGSSSEPINNQQDTGYSKIPASSSPPKQMTSSSFAEIPPQPTIDSTSLFWDMMARSRSPDPHMFPALLALRRSGQFVVGALSNTVIFPPDHPYSKVSTDDPQDVRNQFDVFVGSADVGLRKPDPKIYKMAVDRLNRYDRGRGGDGIRADQVVFLDDIGYNLKAAKELGMRTIKVDLGKTDVAVKELEKITGLKLAGEKAKL